jgi:BASS family bile acid:Na+ symporter
VTPAVQSATVGAVVVLMMLTLGLRVTPATLLAVARRRALVARVLAVNVLGVPLLGVAITSVLATPPAAAAAILLCAAAPGGPLGPVLAGLAAADLPLATGLMLVLAITSVATTPLIAARAVPALAGVHIAALPVLTTVVTFQLAPLALGMATSRAWPRLARRLAAPAATAANLLLAALVAGLLVTRAALLARLGLRSLVAMAAFVAATIVVGSRLGHLPPDRRATAFSTGIRNFSLALLLADTYFSSPAVDAALLSFGAVMLGLPTATALYWRGRPSTEPAAAG